MEKRKKVLSRLFVLLMVVVMFSFSFSGSMMETVQASGQWIDLGGGWKFRVDGPHTGTDTGKYHVHVEGRKGNKTVKGSEGVDGSKSHGDHMNDIPDSVKEKVKKHPKYKDGQKKQKDLDQAKKQIKSRNLKIDWQHVGDVIIAIGIVVACTATFFFQGDDIAAWMNLLRAIGV